MIRRRIAPSLAPRQPIRNPCNRAFSGPARHLGGELLRQLARAAGGRAGVRQGLQPLVANPEEAQPWLSGGPRTGAPIDPPSITRHAGSTVMRAAKIPLFATVIDIESVLILYESQFIGDASRPVLGTSRT